MALATKARAALLAPRSSKRSARWLRSSNSPVNAEVCSRRTRELRGMEEQWIAACDPRKRLPRS